MDGGGSGLFVVEFYRRDMSSGRVLQAEKDGDDYSLNTTEIIHCDLYFRIVMKRESK